MEVPYSTNFSRSTKLFWWTKAWKYYVHIHCRYSTAWQRDKSCEHTTTKWNWMTRVRHHCAHVCVCVCISVLTNWVKGTRTLHAHIHYNIRWSTGKINEHTQKWNEMKWKKEDVRTLHTYNKEYTIIAATMIRKTGNERVREIKAETTRREQKTEIIDKKSN